MSKPQYTPLPWAVWKRAPDSDQKRRHIVVTANGEQAITGIIREEADARHIVRCVNLHDELVQALQQISHYPANANNEPDVMGAALCAIASIASQALAEGDRLHSACQAADGTRFWIITEADRTVTTVLLPDDD